MVEQDVVNIVKIMLTADGGCNICAMRLCHMLIEYYPQFTDLIVRTFNEEEKSNYTVEDFGNV